MYQEFGKTLIFAVELKKRNCFILIIEVHH